MGKKIIIGFLFVFCILSSVLCGIYCGKYRRCDIQFREYKDFTERIESENRKLELELSNIRKGIIELSRDTKELDNLNEKTISGIDNTIKQLQEIREKVCNLENRYNYIINSINNGDNN